MQILNRLPLPFRSSSSPPGGDAETFSASAHSAVEGSPETGDTLQLGSTLLSPARDLLKLALGWRTPPGEVGYKEERGPNRVQTETVEAVDPSRGRAVPMAIYRPLDSAEEETPTVVLSHGLAGNSFTYRYLAEHLASHGYTVVQPTHVGSDTLATLKRSPFLAFGQQELIDRAADVRFALDYLEETREPSDERKNPKAALVGHSFGALTAQAMAGMEFTNEREPVGDQRLSAFVALSPFGESLPSRLLKLDGDSYQNIRDPILFMSGEKERIFTIGKGPKVHEGPFHMVGSEDSHHVTVGGAYHASFAQVFGKFDRNTAGLTASTTTAFLDAHLKGDQTARAYLADDLPRVAHSRDSEALSR